MRTRVVAFLLTAVVSASCSTVSTRSVPAPADTGPLVLASLGDSIASGMGAEGMTMPCARSDRGWTGVLAERAGLDFVNVACAGATIEDAFAQVDDLPEDVSVVAVSIGGNTLGFGPALFLCASGRCAESLAVAEANLPKIRPQTLELLRVVHERRPGVSRILVLLYPPITRPGLVCDGVDEVMSDLFERGPAMLNDELAAAVDDARSEGVPVVAFGAPGFDDHVLCTDEPWFHGFESGVLALHPTGRGYASAGAAAEEALTASGWRR